MARLNRCVLPGSMPSRISWKRCWTLARSASAAKWQLARSSKMVCSLVGWPLDYHRVRMTVFRTEAATITANNNPARNVIVLQQIFADSLDNWHVSRSFRLTKSDVIQPSINDAWNNILHTYTHTFWRPRDRESCAETFEPYRSVMVEPREETIPITLIAALWSR